MANTSTLRVRAVTGILAPVPGHISVHGGQAEYLGRRTDHEAIRANTVVRESDGIRVLKDLEACYPPDPEQNATFAIETHGLAIVSAVRRLIREGVIALNDDVAPTGFAPSMPAPTQARSQRRATNTDHSEDK